MLFAVPDPSFDAPGGKAQPDTVPLDPSAIGTMAEDKVELDIEDAPFLLGDDEPEPAKEELKSDKPLSLDGDAEAKPAKVSPLRNRKVQMGIAAGLLLVVLGGVGWFVTRPKQEVVKPPEPQKVVVPSKPEPPKAPEPSKEMIISLEPFWIEHKAPDGTIRFLVCKFSAATENKQLVMEADAKKLVIRDAVFYYLRNKSLLFLTDGANVDTLKKDLIAIINEYLSVGKLEDLLIENYLVK